MIFVYANHHDPIFNLRLDRDLKKERKENGRHATGEYPDDHRL